MRVGETFEALNGDIGRNLEQHALDDRPAIDAFGHHVHRRAELARSVVEREVRRRPAGIVRRTWVEIVGAKAERIENLPRDDHRACKSEETGAFERSRVKRRESVRSGHRMNGEIRMMPKQQG
jgi:hypothetical protein